MDLQESTSEKKKARRDYTLVWEARPGDKRNLDEAHYRIEIGVAGDTVSSWRSFWKLPEAFTRARSRLNAISLTVRVLQVAVIAGSIVYGIWLIIGNIRQGLVPWGRVMRWAAAAAVLAAAGQLLSLPLLLKQYNTAIPLPTYEALAYSSLVVAVVLQFVLLAAAAAFVLSFYPEAAAALRSKNRRLLGLDAGVAVMAAAGLALALGQVQDWLMSRFPAQAIYSIGASNEVASAAPAVAAAAGAVRTLLMAAATLVLLALVKRHTPRRWMLLALALAALFVNVAAPARTAGEFALSYALALLGGLAAALFCFVFARANYLAYAVVFWILALRPAASELLGTGNPTLKAHGFAVIAIMIASWIWAAAPALRKRPSA
jgi:hypothetical protein